MGVEVGREWGQWVPVGASVAPEAIDSWLRLVCSHDAPGMGRYLFESTGRSVCVVALDFRMHCIRGLISVSCLFVPSDAY